MKTRCYICVILGILLLATIAGVISGLNENGVRLASLFEGSFGFLLDPGGIVGSVLKWSTIIMTSVLFVGLLMVVAVFRNSIFSWTKGLLSGGAGTLSGATKTGRSLLKKYLGSLLVIAGYVLCWYVLKNNFPEDWKVFERLSSFWLLTWGVPAGLLVIVFGKGFSRIVVGLTLWTLLVYGFVTEYHKTPEYQVNAEKARREKAEKAVAKQNLSWSLKRPAEDYTWVTLQPNEWITLRNPGGGNIKGFSGEIGSPTASIIVRITFADGGVKEYLESYTKPLVLSGEVVSISLRSGKKYPVTYGYMFTH